MGSELVIPGTSLDRIPLIDRPNFNANQQNGYTSIGGTPVTAGAGATLRYRLRLATNFSGNGDLKPASGFATIAAGASALVSSLVALPSLRPSCLISYSTAVATNAPTMEELFSSGGGIFLGLPGVPVLIPSIDANTRINNADSVSHVFVVWLSPNAPGFTELTQMSFNGEVPINLDTSLGLTVTSADILRVRSASLSVSGAGTSVRFARDCSIMIFSGGFTVPSEVFPAREFRLRGTASQHDFLNDSSLGKPQRYILDSPIDILGTDFTTGGSFAPLLYVVLSGGGSVITQSFSANLTVFFDLFQGANQ